VDSGRAMVTKRRKAVRDPETGARQLARLHPEAELRVQESWDHCEHMSRNSAAYGRCCDR